MQDGATDISDNTGSVNFGNTLPGTPVTKTFTVTNLGTTNLTLATPISVPAGFTVTSSFGSTTLTPGGSTTFTVRLGLRQAARGYGLRSGLDLGRYCVYCNM